MSCADDRSLVGWLVEEALLTPLDRTIRAVQDLPESVDRARQQLVLARLVGKLAVDQGVREVQRRLDSPDPISSGGSDGATRTARPLRTGGDGSSATPRRSVRPVERTPTPTTGESVPTAADLALPDYEQLPAAHVVAKLGGLQQSERDAIEAFETTHRHRRTILGKLDQLRDG